MTSWGDDVLVFIISTPFDKHIAPFIQTEKKWPTTVYVYAELISFRKFFICPNFTPLRRQQESLSHCTENALR
jgi:hypothetical protein